MTWGARVSSRIPTLRRLRPHQNIERTAWVRQLSIRAGLYSSGIGLAALALIYRDHEAKMALVKNPKPALARSRAKNAKRDSASKRKKLVPIADVQTDARGAEFSPHGLTGNIPLGDRSPSFDKPVQVLQASEDFCGAPEAERLVGRMLIAEFRERHSKRDDGEEWFAWIGTISYHPKGLIFWIGLSSNVPPSAFDALEELIRAMGFPTARATAIPDKHGLEPLLYLGDEGLELLRMI